LAETAFGNGMTQNGTAAERHNRRTAQREKVCCAALSTFGKSGCFALACNSFCTRENDDMNPPSWRYRDGVKPV
jgi:hypothetical protein